MYAPEPTRPSFTKLTISIVTKGAACTFEFRFGVIVLGLIAVASVLHPLLSGIDPQQFNVASRLLPPIGLGEGWRASSPLGTDQLGRDILARSLASLRTSLLIALSAMALTLSIGTVIGVAAGYFGKVIGAVLMRLTDVQLSIPPIILAITVLGLWGASVPLVIGVLAMVSWPPYARVANAIAATERGKDHVRAHEALGASHTRILARVILPAAATPIAQVATLDTARFMIFEGVLAFLGLGVPPPTPTFGGSIADGRTHLLDAWWVSTVPGAFLFLTTASIVLIGSAFEHARRSISVGIR